MKRARLNSEEKSWKNMLSESIVSPTELPVSLGKDTDMIKNVTLRYPMRVTPYYFSLIKHKDDPIYRQCIPDIRELALKTGLEDPLEEERSSPIKGLTHRYPDRVLFLISNKCAVYCRFCNRKRKVGRAGVVTSESIKNGLDYIRKHGEIRDVILSGGDPFLLEDLELDEILGQIRSIPHVEIVRIGTRVPCTLPQRITPDLVQVLKKYHPLYIHTHFNHPAEITPASAIACGRMADAGLPINCQTVLLKNINDNPDIMMELMRKLLTIRVRPYYLFQADQVKGTCHFWTPLEIGLEIINALHGHTSGMCVPHFALDLPGGGGKIPMIPMYIKSNDGKSLTIKNYKGETYRYKATTI